jgi:hypothetical protein
MLSLSIMPRAIWNGKVIAESDTFEEVEGKVYSPLTRRDRRAVSRNVV